MTLTVHYGKVDSRYAIDALGAAIDSKTARLQELDQERAELDNRNAAAQVEAATLVAEITSCRTAQSRLAADT